MTTYRTSKYLAFALGFIILAAIVAFVWRNSQIAKSGFDVPEAANTCASETDPFGVVALQIRSGGDFSIDAGSVRDDQLADRLREIYEIREKRILYLFPDRDIPAQRIVEIINFVKQLPGEESKGIVASEENKKSPERLNIQIRLVTPRALSAPCAKGYFNWGTQGFPSGGASSERPERLIGSYAGNR